VLKQELQLEKSKEGPAVRGSLQMVKEARAPACGKLTSGGEEGSISNWEQELMSTGSNGGVIVSAWREGVPALLVEEKGVVRV
jgi:hypothetical protein